MSAEQRQRFILVLALVPFVLNTLFVYLRGERPEALSAATALLEIILRAGWVALAPAAWVLWRHARDNATAGLAGAMTCLGLEGASWLLFQWALAGGPPSGLPGWQVLFAAIAMLAHIGFGLGLALTLRVWPERAPGLPTWFYGVAAAFTLAGDALILLTVIGSGNVALVQLLPAAAALTEGVFWISLIYLAAAGSLPTRPLAWLCAAAFFFALPIWSRVGLMPAQEVTWLLTAGLWPLGALLRSTWTERRQTA